MPKVMSSGSSSGRGTRRGPRVTTALSEINVVPLVDVMLVLLIIFMVAAPMMQQGLEVKLPESSRNRAIERPAPPVYVTVPVAFGRNRLVQLGDESIRIDVLDERIRQEMRTREKKEVFLRSDGGVTMQQIMDVMDRLKEGGVENVGLLSRPRER